MKTEKLRDGGIGRRVVLPDNEIFTHFYQAKNEGVAPLTRQFIPSFEISLIFILGEPVTITIPNEEPVSYTGCLLIGPVRRAISYTMHPASEIFAGSFKHDAYYRLFGEINPEGNPFDPDRTTDGTPFKNLATELLLLSSAEERAAIVLGFLRPRMVPRETRGERIVELSDFGKNLNPIKVISQEDQISERAVQLQHRKYLGYTAKEMARYRRFLETLKHLEGKALPVDWAEIVASNGYYDQSQLIRDFKFYMNLTPTQFLNSRDSLCSSNVE